jgi:ABC-type multidrug transport system fused ATPase/permease subunit
MSEVAAESFRNVRTVKAFANEDEEARKFENGNLKVFDMGRKKAIFQGIYASLVQVFLYGAMAGVIYTAKEILRRNETQTLVSPGSITAFLFYLFQLVFNFQMIASVLNNVMGILGASDKIVSLMQYESQVKSQGGKILEEHEVQGRFEIKDIKFNYPAKKDVEVLKGISIETNNEEKRVVAICGTSGCGKSSII